MDKREKWQEIANRGLQDRFDPETRAKFDEAVKRGLITLPDNSQPELETISESTNVQKEPNKLDQATSLIEDNLGISKSVTEPLLKNIFAGAEAGATLATGAAAVPISGLVGLAGGDVKETQEKLTVMPTTEGGKNTLSNIGTVLSPVTKAFEMIERGLGDLAFSLTDSPTAASAAATTPTLFSELIGIGIINRLSKGTRLLENGRPTKELKEALDKNGLDFDLLSPEAKAEIPEVANDKIFSKESLLSKDNPNRKAAEDALREQLKSGSRDDALAGLKLDGDRVVPDPLGKEALRQGFEPGVVQSIKTASPETKAAMKEMLSIKQRLKKNASLETQGVRPSNIVGDSLTKRITFIRDKVKDARTELNKIANERFNGLDIDGQPVVDRLSESLDDLDITVNVNDKGVLVPDFAGSIISKDKASQKAIKDGIDLMAEGGKPDALRFHKLKRQLDALIDYRKKAPQGLGKEGKNALKSIRAELNNSLRQIDPDYARVNDVMSEALDTFDSLDKATGRIDIFGESSNRALGQEMRKLLSNYQSRISLEDSVKQIDDLAKKFGADYKDSITDLTLFSKVLDERFGAPRGTFMGEIKSGASQAAGEVVSQGMSGAARQAAARATVKTADKLRGINDFAAFNSLEALLEP